MAMSDARKRANEKWNKENMTTLSCKVRKEYAENVRKTALEMGITVNSVFKAALDDFMNGKTMQALHGSTVQPAHVRNVQTETNEKPNQNQTETKTEPVPEPQQGKKPPKRYPFTVDLPQYLNERCRARFERTRTDPKAFVLQALEAYSRGVSEHNSFLLLFGGMESDGFTLEQVQAAAQAAGIDAGTWIKEAIKDKI